jgi:DNA-binding PadR family transcriptional regulator/nucleoside 2-deoxyribosyltransferase
VSEDAKKTTAFVIQQFDGGKFDRRFNETIRPGITKGGAVPQRADQILGLQPIIQKIENAIQNADICIAEVSTDNPNVWLELGYALALDRPTIILCDKGMRDRLPFDVQHRPVIFYSTESKSGYDDLESRISTEVKHAIETSNAEEKQPVISIGAKDTGELKGYEVSILAALLTAWSSSPNGNTQWEIQKTLGKTSYSETQIAIGLSRLNTRGYVEQEKFEDRDGNDYFSYRITPDGIKWIHQNEAIIEPEIPTKEQTRKIRKISRQVDDFSDDDIPF